jgi:Zn finger protein HypA/HybF involved in hydrogenase expression
VKYMLEMMKPKIHDHVLFAEHNMPCAVCWKESAVLQMQEGIFQPCWTCQSKGYRVVKKRKRRRGKSS